MTEVAGVAREADSRLQAAEALLNQALDALTHCDRGSPGVICAESLAKVAAELRALGEMVIEHGEAVDRALLRQRVSALLPRLQRVERLLAASAEFYRGWCAAVPAPLAGYPGTHDDAGGWSNAPGPALLALEC